MKKFKIGDRVKILNVKEYVTDYNHIIPKELIIHGSAILNSSDPKARIVAIHNEYYIVNFLNDNRIHEIHGKNEMQLGFLEKHLIFDVNAIQREQNYEIY